MSTTAVKGTVSANATAPTVVTFSPMSAILGLTVSDGTSWGGGFTRYTVNAEAVNTASSANSAIPANGVMTPIIQGSGIGTVTLYASGGETNQTYAFARLKYNG